MKLLLYCTKSKPYLMNLNTKYFISSDRESLRYIDKQDMKKISYNGKIVAECDYEVIKNEGLIFEELFNKETQLSLEQMALYTGVNDFYCIHIKNLNIFDEPRELNEFTTFTNLGEPIKRPPQNMCKVIDDLDHNCESYILISIRPEYLVKILNKEKTIEIRKKVLKEML